MDKPRELLPCPAPDSQFPHPEPEVPQETCRLRPKPVASRKRESFARALAVTKPKRDTSCEERVLELSAKTQIRWILSRPLNEIDVFCRSASHMGATKMVIFGAVDRVFQRVPKIQNSPQRPGLSRLARPFPLALPGATTACHVLPRKDGVLQQAASTGRRLRLVRRAGIGYDPRPAVRQALPT